MTSDVSARHITLSAVRDAAAAIYDAAIRTPLIRLELPDNAPGPAELYLKLEALQPIGSFKIRGAYNVVRQLPPTQLTDGVWTVSAGNAAQGVAFAARQARRALLGDGHGHGARHEDPRHRAARRHDRPRQLRRVLADGRGARLGPHDRATSCIRSMTTASSPATARPALEILEDLPDVDAIVAPLGGGGLLAGHRSGGHGDCGRTTRIFAAEPETAAPLAASLAAGRPLYFDGWTASFVDGAGGKSVLPTMWPLLARLSRLDRRVARRGGRARCGWSAERARVIAEGAAGCAVAAAPQRPGRRRQGRRRRVRRQHRPLDIRGARRRLRSTPVTDHR